MAFFPVACPRCGEIVMEIATGLVRVRCRGRSCKARVWAMSDGKEVRVGLVDKPLARLQNTSNRISVLLREQVL